MVIGDITGETGIFIDGDWIESKDQDPNGDVRLIQLADIGEGDFKNKSDRHITSEKAKELNCTFLKKGDILIARLGEPLCKACIFPLDGKNITAVDIAIFRTDREDIFQKYLVYLLNSPWFKSQVKLYESGTTRKRISRKNLNKIEIPIPSISEQQRIVSRIEKLFSSLDNAVETLQKTKEHLLVYRQAVLKEAFEGNYTPDVSMCEIPMEEIADGKDGLRRGPFGSAIKKSFFVESGYKVYEQGNAINDDCKRGHYYISEEKYNELSSFQLRPGDYIVSCSGTIGKIAQLPVDAEPGVINQALMRIRLKPEVIDPYYFILQFRSEVFQRKIVSRGSGMGNLAGIKEFKLATMFVPENREKQKYIVAEIESRMSVCDSIEQTVNTALLQAEAMRQSILKEAFEGRL